FTTWPEEVEWVCDRIVELGPASGDRGWADIAVLTRRNADIAAVYAHLTALDVPAEIVGLGGLLELPEIQDVVATLRVLDDVTATPDVVRLLAGPRWAIGPDDLASSAAGPATWRRPTHPLRRSGLSRLTGPTCWTTWPGRSPMLTRPS